MEEPRRRRRRTIDAATIQKAKAVGLSKDREGWTAQQRLFMKAWERFQDVRKAAKAAGYSDPDSGRQLAKKPHIKKAMQEWEERNFLKLLDQIERSREWNDNEILTALVAATRNDFTDYYQDEPDHFGVIRVKPLSDLTYPQRLLITKISNKALKLDKETNIIVTEYEFLSKEWAYEKLAQTFGTFKLAEIAERLRMTPDVLLGHKIRAANMGLSCD